MLGLTQRRRVDERPQAPLLTDCVPPPFPRADVGGVSVGAVDGSNGPIDRGRGGLMLCKQEVTGSIPVGSTPEVPARGRILEGTEPRCIAGDRP